MPRESVEVGSVPRTRIVCRGGRAWPSWRSSQRVQDNDSAAATPGLTATFSGKAFARAAESRAPVMRVHDLRQGGATSGTVTVGNPGPGTRYFWLSPGRVTERLGAGGGRLTSAVALTVMDVSDISAPSVVYRGPLRYVGARPLGFLDPGARRSFSFVAERPAGGAPARAGGRPLPRRRRQDRLDLALAGRPAGRARPRRPPAGEAQARPRAPTLTFSVPAASSCWSAGRWP